MKSLKEYLLDLSHKPFLTKEGYKQVYRPKHPNARANGYVPEHIYNATSKGKFSLKSDEVVHHKDGNKINNKPSNLQIVSRSEHTKIHNK